jgi:Zn-finger nucleic acid-binding protein
MDEPVKYKCHWCEFELKSGQRYTLECANCGYCGISFNAAGDLTHYILFVRDERQQYTLCKRKYSDTIDLFDRQGYRIFSLKASIQFTDGMPQADKMFEKMKTLLLFS